MTRMAGEDRPSIPQPRSPATAGAEPGGLQGDEPTSGNHSATDANDDSDETSAAPQEQGRIRRWRNKLRPPTKSTTIIVTAFIGFMFGIASSQVSDFVKRADDCYDALSEYEVNVASNFYNLSNGMHSPDLNEQQKDALGTRYNTLVSAPIAKAINKCPVNPPMNTYTRRTSRHLTTPTWN
jgi:hypothetical protein